MTAAERIKGILESRGIKYVFISQKTGIPVNKISCALNGKRRLPADEMIAICNAVNIDLSELQNTDPPQAE